MAAASPTIERKRPGAAGTARDMAPKGLVSMQRADYIVDPTTGCWVWQKSTRQGYGRANRGGKLVTAHIWYWEKQHGPVPEGMDLDHTCHNGSGCPGGFDCPHRRCVNPDHLEPVTRVENVRRGVVPKLTADQAAEIRASNQPVAVLAERYGVTTFNISAIRQGKTWREIGTPYERPAPLGRPIGRGVRLTEEQIAEIRAAPRYHGSGRALAHKYGVSDACISTLRG